MSVSGNGFGESARRFSDEVGAAVARARRAAAEAGTRSASFRAESEQLVDRLRAGAAQQSAGQSAGQSVGTPTGEATSEELRLAAISFRAGHGLLTEDFPEDFPEDSPDPAAGPDPSSQAATSGNGPVDGDEDDDFSHERIMKRR